MGFGPDRPRPRTGKVGRLSGQEKKIMGFYNYVQMRSQGLLVVKYDHV
jgi:hypothetical protein